MPDGSSSLVPAIGQPEVRIDGRAKVTGQARYPSDEPFAGAAWAWLVVSSIANGRVTGFDLAEARATPGWLDILTHENVGGEIRQPPPAPSGQGKTTTTLESDHVWHDGQIVAVVLAETLEAAREAAAKVKVLYAPETPSATFDSPGAVQQSVAEAEPGHEDHKVGDAEAAWAAAPVKIEARYSTPTQHHNPMELFTTTCAWDGGRLTVQESSQFVQGLRGTLARQLGMEQKDIRVLSKYIGGAFGSRGGATSRTVWIAIAARRLKRPVKLVASRAQGFTIATYRAETRQHVKLAAGRDGRLQAVIHEGIEVTSRPTPYNVSGVNTTASLYASPAIATKVDILRADRNTPGFMRAPPETPYMFAFESAVDELAAALAMDPVALRKINDTRVEPIKGRPFTSRSLVPCLDQAARAFGWEKRNPVPGSMRDRHWLIGWGCASAIYTANIGAASARLRLNPDGTAKVQLSAQDLGTGTYTILAQVAADRLGLPMDKVSVEIGDSDLPAAGLSAGSNHAASISNVVAKAADEIKARLVAAGARPDETPARAMARLGSGPIEVYAENVPDGAPPDGIAKIEKGQMAMARGSELKDHVAYAFGAQFVEVRVHRRTAEIRVPRAVGAFAAGTILNALTARSQLMGGMIWGLSAALMEKTDIDLAAARYVGKDLADYLIPVNADIGEVEVILVPEEDHQCNPLGVKGVGELGIVGMNAAVANAVFHATGRRVRDLPIRIEHLL